jgi:uncharacterized membrane protein YcjF (UPF0283 family)
MLMRLWRKFLNALLAVGIVLSFFAVIEVIRAYEVLYDLHPFLGDLFVALILVGVLWLPVYYALGVGRRGTVLVPPPRQDLQAAGNAARRAYARYLGRVMKRLSENSYLAEGERRELADNLRRFSEVTGRKPGREAMLATLREAETRVVAPVIARLDALADKEVRTCVRDVMLGVTLSPWRSVDVLVVLYRNARMVVGITRIYESRPRLREQILILRDVAGVVATVNFLNYGSRLLQNLTASVPLLGRYTDDVAQGIGAGLLTSVTGHAAADRCRAFRGWDQAEAQETIRRRLKDFVADMRGIVTTDLFSKISRPVASQLPEDAEKPKLLALVRDGIAAAMDETDEVIDSFVRRPVVAAGRGVVTTGTRVGGAALRGAAVGSRAVWSGGRSVGGLISRATVGTGRAVWCGTTTALRGTGRGVVKLAALPARVFRRVSGRRRSDS